jgi:hypothetical protein
VARPGAVSPIGFEENYMQGLKSTAEEALARSGPVRQRGSLGSQSFVEGSSCVRLSFGKTTRALATVTAFHDAAEEVGGPSPAGPAGPAYQAIKELEKMELNLIEERQRGDTLKEKYEDMLATEREAHARDVRMLEQMLQELAGENARLAVKIQKLEQSRADENGDKDSKACPMEGSTTASAAGCSEQICDADPCDVAVLPDGDFGELMQTCRSLASDTPVIVCSPPSPQTEDVCCPPVLDFPEEGATSLSLPSTADISVVAEKKPGGAPDTPLISKAALEAIAAAAGRCAADSLGGTCSPLDRLSFASCTGGLKHQQQLQQQQRGPTSAGDFGEMLEAIRCNGRGKGCA